MQVSARHNDHVTILIQGYVLEGMLECIQQHHAVRSVKHFLVGIIRPVVENLVAHLRTVRARVLGAVMNRRRYHLPSPIYRLL